MEIAGLFSLDGSNKCVFSQPISLFAQKRIPAITRVFRIAFLQSDIESRPMHYGVRFRRFTLTLFLRLENIHFYIVSCRGNLTQLQPP